MSVRPRLVLATLNAAKGREMVALLGDAPFDIVSLADVPGAVAPAESAPTYAGNALIKARAASSLTGCLALADDSGLEVDALGGAPGVLSARYGGPGLSDAERVSALLRALAGVAPELRTARFRSVIAVVAPGGPEHVVEGVVEGLIAELPRGEGGFGYDPVFFYPPLGRTFAELTADEKARVDHRGRALAAARPVLARAARARSDRPRRDTV